MELALFSYRRGNSFLHRMNAGVKNIFLFAFSFFVFWGKTPNTAEEVLDLFLLIRIAISFLIGFSLFLLSGANWKSLLGLRFVFALGIMYTLLKMIGEPLDGFACGLLYTARFFVSAWAAQSIFETTTMVQIQDSLRLPMVVNLAINFIPLIFSEWEKIKIAARARVGQSKKGFFKSIFIILYEMQTLLFVMLQKAERVRRAVSNRQ